MIRRDVLAMAWEVCAAREDFDSYEPPLAVIDLLEGGDCDDPTGRAAILIMCFPGTMSSAEAIKLGLDPEIIEAARLSEEALSDLEV